MAEIAGLPGRAGSDAAHPGHPQNHDHGHHGHDHGHGALRLQLAWPHDGAPPAWLDEALAALVRREAGRVVRVAAAAHLVLHLQPPAMPATPARPATHWALCDGDGRALSARRPLLDDISAGRGITLRCLQHDPASGGWPERRRLRLACSPRLASARPALVAAVQRLLALALASHRQGVPLQSSGGLAPGPLPAAAPAGLPVLVRQQLRGLARAGLDRLRAVACSESWRIGVIEQPLAQLLQPGPFVAPLPPVRWLTQASAAGHWADPFGMPGDDRRLFCEHVDGRTGVGRIECLTLPADGDGDGDGDGATPQRRPLAVGGGCHTSFPLVCSLDGQRLGVAETLAAGAVLLHAVDDDGSWRPLWPLLQGVAAADPALFEWQGRSWLAITDSALGAQDNLCLYHADSLRGPWLPHADNPVKVDIASARMGGGLFQHDGVLYRPGQDCLHGYGAAVVLHRIDTLTPTAFAETAVRRLQPDPAGPCPHGLHTVSGWGERTLVDGKRLVLRPAAVLRKLLRAAARTDPGPRQPAAARAAAPGPAPLPATATAAAAAAAPTTAADTSAIFVYVPHLRTGGGELSMLELAAGFADAGRPVTLVVHTARTQELVLPPGVQLLSLGLDAGSDGTAAALWQLALALRRQRPRWLLSAFPHSNVAAVAATALANAGAGNRTLCVVSEHAPVSLQIAQHGGLRYRLLPPLLRWAYPRAAAVVAVSDGVRSDLLALVGAAAARLAPLVIRNPVLGPTLDAELAQPPDHPWLLDPALQVVLAVGRLAEEKGLPTLLRAFNTLHASRPATRLLLAGEGPERWRLQALVDELGLQQVVQLPGRTRQPLRWMRHAAVLVLASRFEGFGNVLVEALACGTPVVATDCPVGPREILQGGRFGALVPVGDADAMAVAIVQALQQRRTLPPGAHEAALQHTRQRASAAYLALFERLAASAQGGRARPC